MSITPQIPPTNSQKDIPRVSSRESVCVCSKAKACLMMRWTHISRMQSSLKIFVKKNLIEIQSALIFKRLLQVFWKEIHEASYLWWFFGGNSLSKYAYQQMELSPFRNRRGFFFAHCRSVKTFCIVLIVFVIFDSDSRQGTEITNNTIAYALPQNR